MTNQKVTVLVPEGKKAVQITDKDGNICIMWVDAEPTRSKSWEEYCENHPTVKEEYRLNSVNGETIPERNVRRRRYPALLETKEDTEALLALIKLKRLRDEWLDGWKPDWNNKNQVKYCVFYKGNTLFVGAFYVDHVFLAFPADDMATSFRERHRNLIEQAKPFLQ